MSYGKRWPIQEPKAVPWYRGIDMKVLKDESNDTFAITDLTREEANDIMNGMYVAYIHLGIKDYDRISGKMFEVTAKK